jgi:hypothetical protein
MRVSDTVLLWCMVVTCRPEGERSEETRRPTCSPNPAHLASVAGPVLHDE